MHKEDGIFLMAVQMNQNYFRCIICVYYLVSSTERSNVLLYNYFVSFILLFLYRYNQRCICKLTFFSVSTYDWTKPSSLCVNKILNHFQSSLCNLVLTILTFFLLLFIGPKRNTPRLENCKMQRIIWKRVNKSLLFLISVWSIKVRRVGVYCKWHF